MTPFVALGLLLALAALVFVLFPVLRPAPVGLETSREQSEREAQRGELYRQILEIEFDQRVGKIDPADAQALSDRLLGRAAQLVAADATSPQGSDIEAEIEREVAALRRALEGAADRELGAART